VPVRALVNGPTGAALDNVSATDLSSTCRVVVSVDSGSPVCARYTPAAGFFRWMWNTAGTITGTHVVTVRVLSDDLITVMATASGTLDVIPARGPHAS